MWHHLQNVKYVFPVEYLTHFTFTKRQKKEPKAPAPLWDLSFRFAPNHVSGKCGAQHSFIKLITVFQVQSEIAKFRFTIFQRRFPNATPPPAPYPFPLRFLWGNCNCNAVICHRFAFWFLNGFVWFWITAGAASPPSPSGLCFTSWLSSVCLYRTHTRRAQPSTPHH